MASKSQSRASTKLDDSLWRQKLQDNKSELSNSLKKISMTVLKRLHVFKIIGDEDYHSLRNLKPANIVDGILRIIETKEKREYLIFRDVLKENRQLALYKLLDIEKIERNEDEESNYDGELGDLRQKVCETNKKMDGVLEAIHRLEAKHDVEIKEIRSMYQQKQIECEKLTEENTRLKKEIKTLKTRLQQSRGSKENVTELENDLKTKNEELQMKERMKTNMETEIQKLRRQLAERERSIQDKDTDIKEREETIEKQRQTIDDLTAGTTSDVEATLRPSN